MKPKPVNSSYIAAYEYDADKYTLTVLLKNGTELKYKDIKPPTISSVFDSPGSVGSKFLKQIAAKFPVVHD